MAHDDPMEKPRETFRRLAALASGAASTDAERATAQRLMAKYLERYGSEINIPESEPEIRRQVKFSNEYESRLSIHCGLYAGCSCRKVGRVVYEGTSREAFRGDGKTTSFVGAESAVIAAVELYEHHRKELASLLEVAENGYRFGAMPLPAGKVNAKPRKMSEALSNALAAASDIGRSSTLVKRLGRG